MGQLFAKLLSLFWGKSMDLCIVGLENSGKTTLVNQINLGQAVDTLPTVGLNVTIVQKDNVKMKVFDLGGQERFRSEWPRYTSGADVIIFVVDGHDYERVPFAKKELSHLLEDKNLAGKPLLVALNKIDLEPRMTQQEIVKQLNLDYIQDRPWVVTPISALHGTNTTKLLEWLISHAK